MPNTFDNPGAAQLQTYAAGLAPDPNQNLDAYLVGCPRFGDGIEDLRGMASSAQTLQNAALELSQTAREDYDAAKAKRDGRVQWAKDSRVELDAEELAYLDNLVATTRKRLDESQAQASKATRNRVAARKYHTGAMARAAKMMRDGTIPQFVDIVLKGPPLDEMADSQAKITKLKVEAAAVTKAPRGAAADEAELLATLDGLRAQALPRINLRGKKPSISWPVEGITAAAAHDRAELPHATFALPLAVLANYDALAAHIEQQVAEFYAGQPLVLDEAQKAKRLAEIDDEILAAERVEAAAVWAARAQGIEVFFREDISNIEAVLGIK